MLDKEELFKKIQSARNMLIENDGFFSLADESLFVERLVGGMLFHHGNMMHRDLLEAFCFDLDSNSRRKYGRLISRALRWLRDREVITVISGTPRKYVYAYCPERRKWTEEQNEKTRLRIEARNK